MQRYSLQYYKNFAKEKGGDCLSASYKNVRTKLRFSCDHGHEWEAQPRKINEGSWCPECHKVKLRKYSADFDFFKNDTPESFYVAGFIAADGWVRSISKYGYTLGIKLSIKDIDHLENIKTLIKSNYKIKTFTKSNECLKKLNPIVKETSETCSFKIHNKDINKGLERFNIFQAKTYDLDMPDWLKNHKYVSHFMRGYIDGDGCFYIKKNNKYKSICFVMRGTAKFLQSFHDILKDKGIVNCEREIKPINGKKRPAFNRLSYNGNYTLSKLYDFLYDDCTVCLERKRAIAAKSKEWVVKGTDRKKKPKQNTFFTTEELLEKAKELKSQKKLAEYFGCTSANISWWTKYFGIKDEFNKAVGKVDKKDVLKLYNELKNGAKTAKRLGISKTYVSQIIKENKNSLKIY